MSYKTSCFYSRYQPSKSNVFLILAVIFIVGTFTSIVFGETVDCFCEIPEEARSQLRQFGLSCDGGSKKQCTSGGGCSTVEIVYHKPELIRGKRVIVKGCGAEGAPQKCQVATNGLAGIKFTTTTCYCQGNLCNSADSVPTDLARRANSGRGDINSGGKYLKSNWALFTFCLFATILFSLFLFNRK